MTPEPKHYIEELTEQVYQINYANGWYDRQRPFSADVALLHTEVCEAYEAFRSGEMKTWFTDEGEPVGMPVELADILIRLIDTADRYDVDLVGEVKTKLAWNARREYRHGGKQE